MELNIETKNCLSIRPEGSGRLDLAKEHLAVDVEKGLNGSEKHRWRRLSDRRRERIYRKTMRTEKWSESDHEGSEDNGVFEDRGEGPDPRQLHR